MKSKSERKSSLEAIKEAGYGATATSFRICPRVSAIRRKKRKIASKELYQWLYHFLCVILNPLTVICIADSKTGYGNRPIVISHLSYRNFCSARIKGMLR